jgi:phosphate transport system permease protein
MREWVKTCSFLFKAKNPMATSDSKTRNAASRRLHAMDSAAEFVVTTGGFIVLAAVLGICLYLLWVVVPLFAKGSVGERVVGSTGQSLVSPRLMVDPYSHALTIVDTEQFDTKSVLMRAGAVLGSSVLALSETEPTAMSFSRNGEVVAIGYRSGSIILGELTYTNSLVGSEQEISNDDEHALVEAVESGYIEHLGDGRGRQVVFESEFGEPISLKAGEGTLVAIDYRKDPTGKKILAALREDGTVLVNTVRTTRPLGGGTPKVRLSTKSFALSGTDTHPDWFLVTADGAHVLCVWESGTVQRYARVDRGDFELIETRSFIDPSSPISTASMLLGGQTLMLGQDDGTVTALHVAKDKTGKGKDGMMLVRSHKIESRRSPIVSISSSIRDRSVAILYQDGVVDLRHMTSEKLVSRIETGIENPTAAAIAPKNNGVVVFGQDGSYSFHEVEPGYPEFSVKALFGRVHFEGVAEPEYVYQSSSGDDASEIKLSLMPLIFGTLKATVFAMIFAIPIAVLAAIYSSEFVSRRVRRKVKPTVELMASLPSVVLGFVAAMVVAPFVASHLDTFVIGMVVIPMTILLGAHLWQLIPLSYRLRTRTGHHLMLVGLVVLLGAAASTIIGPSVVRSWFAPDQFDGAMMAGDYTVVDQADLPSWSDDAIYNTRTQRRLRVSQLGVVDGVVVKPNQDGDYSEVLSQLGLSQGNLQRWLNSEYGRAGPGWVVVFFPASCFVMWVAQAVFVRRKLDLIIIEKEGLTGNLFVLAKFVVVLVLSYLLALVAASIAERLGFDPRDSVFGSFSPRNTMVVAIIMGFAVIPIIFTISEDALQAVPMTLRTASLGAGATPWQTAMRVVMPVAASGIFSACMIGFGRAVGETMIVLMATGNTPEMDWNIFSGFRTLAANIAVELPEAPKDETHYRVLFLCGLVLFVMTFVINTLAELVRRVVRARNAGL